MKFVPTLNTADPAEIFAAFDVICDACTSQVKCDRCFINDMKTNLDPSAENEEDTKMLTFAIERDNTKYGTDILEVFAAPDRDSAIDYAIAYCISPLKEAYEDLPDEIEELLMEFPFRIPRDCDEAIATHFDPECINGFINEECYIDLKEVPNRAGIPCAKLSADDMVIVNIVRNSEDPAEDLLNLFQEN